MRKATNMKNRDPNKKETRKKQALCRKKKISKNTKTKNSVFNIFGEVK